MTGRLPAPAAIWPEVAFATLRDHPEVLRAWAAKSRTLSDPEMRRHFAEAVVFVRQAAHDWAVWAGVSGTAVQAVYGTTAMPETADESESRCPPPRMGLSVSQVATKLEVKERQVLNLIATERLVATRGPGRGRPWVIDEVSVAIEARRRDLDERDQ